MAKLTLRPTTEKDLENVMRLWNHGEVTKYVGFPEGIGVTVDDLRPWLARIEAHRPHTEHWAIYDEDGRYCGEAFHRLSENPQEAASLDIKLLPEARGKGIATAALRHAIESAFALGATKVCVDPSPENKKALALYERLGFSKVATPKNDRYDPQDAVYMELTEDTYRNRSPL